MSFAELRQKCADGQIGRLSDRVWFEGAEDWVPVIQIEGLFPGSTPPPAPTPPTVGAGGPPPLHQPVHTPIKSASFHLILGLGLGFWCCYIAAIANFVIGVGESRDALVAAGGLLIVVAVGLGVTFVVVCCIYVYRMWKIIQGYTTRATPGIAVGFLFIPFFNVYWIFQAFHGWSKDYNQFVYNTQRADAPSMPEGLFLTFAILCVISAVPYIGLLAFIPQTIVFFIVAYHICRAINHFADRY